MTEETMYPPGLELHGSTWRVTKRVPKDLQSHYPKKLIRLSTGESDKRKAASVAWELLAKLESEFTLIRASGSRFKSTVDDETIDWLVGQMISHCLQSYERALDEQSLPPKAEFEQALDWMFSVTSEFISGEPLAILGLRPIVDHWLAEEGYQLDHESLEYSKVAARFAKGVSKALQATRSRRRGEWVESPPIPERTGTRLGPGKGTDNASVPSLQSVVESFLGKQDKTRPMYSKYQPVLKLFVELLGDVPITQIKQKDIDGFFDLVCKLPPRWRDDLAKLGVPVRALAEMEWPKTISPKTFDGTYKGALRPFLQESIRLYGDQGFPAHLTVEGIKYQGSRKVGENKQRALKPEEIRKLFGATVYREFAQTSPEAFWLPLVGLFTGARINEVCQLNPQCDVREEDGIWFFDFTEDTEGEEGVRKSVKTATSKRQIPIHSTLIALGFLKYVENVKATGAKLLFPKWRPERGKASAKAEDWFRQFLAEIELRDETPFARVVGFHCFRSTFAARAQALSINEAPILGHADDGSAVQRGYRGKRPLVLLQGIVESITFDEVDELLSWVQTQQGL